MRHRKSEALYSYWNTIRAGKQAPHREEIEPSDIRNLLGDTFILDVSGSMRTISYRLAGTRLCAAFGKELKGVGFLVPWDEQDCFEIARMLTRVYRDFEPQMVSSIAKTASGKFVEFESVFLPLQPVSEGSYRILGITTPEKAPYWLGAEPITAISVRSIRTISESEIDHSRRASLSPAKGDLAAFSDKTATDLTDTKDTTGARQVAHLTVLDGGKT